MAAMALCLCAFLRASADTLTLPSRTLVVEKEAFYGDTALDTVVLPEGVLRIEERAFAYSSVHQVVLPESLLYIADNAFEGCENIKAETKPGSAADLWCEQNGVSRDATVTGWSFSSPQKGTVAITGYSGTGALLRIPETDGAGNPVTAIAEGAFQNNTRIRSVEFHEGIAEIGANAFAGCTGIDTDLFLPYNCKTIGAGAFSSYAAASGTVYLRDFNYSLSTIFPDAEHTVFAKYALLTDGGAEIRSYSIVPAQLVLPDTVCGHPVTSVGNSAFRGKTELQSVAFPDTLLKIGEYAFRSCTNLQGTLTLPPHLQEIGIGAFRFCSGLTGRLEIPESVEYLGSHCFEDAGFTELADISPNVRNQYAYSAFEGCNFTDTDVLMVPCIKGISINPPSVKLVYQYTVLGDGGAEITRVCWNDRNNTPQELHIPETAYGYPVVALGEEMMYNSQVAQKSITVTIPDTVRSIGASAFLGTLRGELTLPAELRIIGEGAFSGCDLTGNLIMPEKLYEIGNSAFYGCSNLEHVDMSVSLMTIGDRAFYNCRGLKGGLALGENVISIGKEAFYGCSGIEQVVFRENLRSIGKEAFRFCSGLTGSITFGDALTSIGEGAFSNCSSLEGPLYFGNSLTEIGKQAFYQCTSLKGGLSLPDTLKTIGDSAFEGTKLDGDVKMSAGLFAIGEKAFWYVPIKSVTGFGPDLDTIGAKAFQGCSSLTGSLTLPSARQIGEYAFSGCAFDGTLTLPDNLTSIGEQAFFKLQFRGDLRLPDSLVTVGPAAFFGCGFDGALTLPAHIIRIEGEAFSGCTALKGTPDFGDSLTYLGGAAFSGCVSLSGAPIFPETLVSIGGDVFKDCSGMTGSLRLPDSLTSIGSYCFSQCSGLTGTLHLPAHLEYIGGFAFWGCGFTGELVLPNTLTGIGACAFSGCGGFRGDLILPDHLILQDSSNSYAFTGIGCDGKLVLPYYMAGGFFKCDECFEGTRFSAVYVGPYMTDLSGSSPFKNYRGQTPVPLYYSAAEPPVYYSEIFDKDHMYAWSASPRAESERAEHVKPELLIESSYERVGAADADVTLTLTCQAPENAEGKIVDPVQSPYIVISGSTYRYNSFTFDLQDGQRLYKDTVMCRTLRAGESTDVKLRITRRPGGESATNWWQYIEFSAKSEDGSIVSRVPGSTLSKIYLNYAISAKPELKLYADYQGGKALKATYDSKQLLQQSADFDGWEITVQGDLEISEFVTFSNTKMRVTGDLKVKNQGVLVLFNNCDVTVDGEVTVGEGVLADLFGNSSRLELSMGNTRLACDELNVRPTGRLRMDADSCEIVARVLNFESESDFNVLTKGVITVEEEAKLNYNFNGSGAHALKLNGKKLSIKTKSGKSPSVGTLVLNSDLTKLDLTSKLTSILKVAALVVTDDSLKTLNSTVKSFLSDMESAYKKLQTKEDALTTEDLWLLTLKASSVPENEADMRALAARALNKWFKEQSERENRKKDISSFKALYENMTQYWNSKTEYKNQIYNGYSYQAVVNPSYMMTQGSSDAGFGTITLTVQGKQLEYVFSLSNRGQKEAVEAYLSLSAKAMYETLSKQIDQAASSVPYIGPQLAKAAKIYIMVVSDEVSFDEALLAVSGNQLLTQIKKEFPTVGKYIDLFATVCNKKDDLNNKLSQVKDYFKKASDVLKGESGFALNQEALVKKALDYIQDELKDALTVE